MAGSTSRLPRSQCTHFCVTDCLQLVEAVVLPMSHPERFANLGIKPPKGMKTLIAKHLRCMSGVLMYGPPGTGKTLMARACAAKSKATFLKLAGPQLVQVDSN